MISLRIVLNSFPAIKSQYIHKLLRRLFLRGQLQSGMNPAHSQAFKWKEISNFIDPNLFKSLYNEFPSIEFFENHQGVPRGPYMNQRPHDRYYLALDNSIYAGKSDYTPVVGKGIIQRSSLSECWSNFIEYLESPAYNKFASDFLGTSEYDVRFAWHMAYSGCEVSPHVDAVKKLGTHIFYFNTPSDWKPEWGGQTVLLRNLKRQVTNPEFIDFGRYHEVSNIGNNSLLWRNSPTAWHGVRPISPPPGFFRKICTVVFGAVQS